MIEYLGAGEPPSGSALEVEFVGGPRAGERIVMATRPETIGAAAGSYRRSVSCADDGAQRYVWEPLEVAGLGPEVAPAG